MTLSNQPISDSDYVLTCSRCFKPFHWLKMPGVSCSCMYCWKPGEVATFTATWLDMAYRRWKRLGFAERHRYLDDIGAQLRDLGSARRMSWAFARRCFDRTRPFPREDTWFDFRDALFDQAA